MRRHGRISTLSLPAVAALLLLVGSSCAPDASGAGGVPGRRSDRLGPDAGPASCARPAEGCTCDAEDKPVTCYLEPERDSDGRVLCQKGTRYCQSGTWGTCQNIRSYVPNASSSEVGGARVALVTGPETCDDCNPDCIVSRDYPDEDDLDETNSDGVEFNATEGGLVLPGSGGSGSTGLADTDGDGVPDVADDFPADNTLSGVEGGFYHTLDYNGASPTDPFSFTTQVRTADIYFLMDTTGSMGGEIANLRAALTSGTYVTGCPGGIIGGIQCAIPDASFGVGRLDDFPVPLYGDASSGDQVYQNVQDITSSTASAQAAVNTLAVRNGSDWPESHSQALYSLATGNGIGSYVAARTTCAAGTWGYPCFRTGTIPIVIIMTDAPYHNGPNTAYNYSTYDATSATLAASSTTAVPTTTSNGETCSNQYNIGTVSAAWKRFTGNTSAFANNYTTCGYGNGRDQVLRFTLATQTELMITLAGSAFNSSLALVDSACSYYNACLDDTVGDDPAFIANLAAGNYLLFVDGRNSTDHGAYRLEIGPTSLAFAPTAGIFPAISWATVLSSLTARGIKIITVESSGGYADAQANAVTLANATSSVDGTGVPFVYSIPTDGSGLPAQVVTAVQTLANYSRMDVTVRAVDNAATGTVDESVFLDTVTASTYDAGRCTGISGGSTFTQCLPGTNLGFDVTFNNSSVMPTLMPQVFDFTLEVVGDGTYILDTIPVRVTVPAASPSYPASGTYARTYDATTLCEIPPSRPDWGQFVWTAETPSDSYVTFTISSASAETDLGTDNVTVSSVLSSSPQDIGALLTAAGYLNNDPYLRVTATLYSSTDGAETPVLSGFELEYTCVPIE